MVSGLERFTQFVPEMKYNIRLTCKWFEISKKLVILVLIVTKKIFFCHFSRLFGNYYQVFFYKLHTLNRFFRCKDKRLFVDIDDVASVTHTGC